jgi:aminomethyltransferase
LGFLISADKNFCGKAALLKKQAEGISNRLCGFMMMDKAVARDGYPIYKEGRAVGKVTSGSYSPLLKSNIGLASVEKELAKMGSEFDVEIHGKMAKAKVVKLPFVPIRHL